MKTLSIGHSPDADDAFMFYGLASERVVSAAGPSVVAADAGDRKITGFSREVHAYDIKGLDSARTMS